METKLSELSLRAKLSVWLASSVLLVQIVHQELEHRLYWASILYVCLLPLTLVAAGNIIVTSCLALCLTCLSFREGRGSKQYGKAVAHATTYVIWLAMVIGFHHRRSRSTFPHPNALINTIWSSSWYLAMHTGSLLAVFLMEIPKIRVLHVFTFSAFLIDGQAL